MTVTSPEVRKIIAGWQEELRRMTDNNVLLLISFHQPSDPIDFERIRNIVCHTTGVPFHKVVKRDRVRMVTLTRHLIAYYAYNYGNMTLKQIGEKIGAYDHTTVLHGKEKIKSLLESGDMLTCMMSERINKQIA
jgi:chromosomal replication initiation ATPase DnaA